MMCLNISLHILNENLIRPDQDEIIGRPVKNYRDYGYGLYCYNEFEHAQQTNNLTKIREMFANSELTITSQIHSDAYYYNTSTQFIEWYVLKDTQEMHTKYRWHVDGQVMNYEAINIVYKDWDCDDLYEVSVQRNINHNVNSDYLVQQFIKSHGSFKRWVDYMTNTTIQILNTTDNITIYAEYFDKELSYCWIAPTPVQTPFETSIQTVTMSPIQTPLETIVPTPFQTPAHTQLPTPIQTHVCTPFETILPTPIQSSFETIAPTPIQTSFETIASTPIQTPTYTISNESANANATNLPKSNKNKPNTPIIIVVASVAIITVASTTVMALKKKFKCCLSANFEDQYGFTLDNMSVVL